jgi:hypothetical protein
MAQMGGFISANYRTADSSRNGRWRFDSHFICCLSYISPYIIKSVHLRCSIPFGGLPVGGMHGRTIKGQVRDARIIEISLSYAPSDVHALINGSAVGVRGSLREPQFVPARGVECCLMWR